MKLHLDPKHAKNIWDCIVKTNKAHIAIGDYFLELAVTRATMNHQSHNSFFPVLDVDFVQALEIKQDQGPKMEQFKLTFPKKFSDITAEELREIEPFIDYDGQTCTFKKGSLSIWFYYFEDGSNFRDGSILADWLEPIEDGPVSAGEALKKHCGNEGMGQSYEGGYLAGFEDGETNHSKRVKPVIDAVKGALRIKKLWQPPQDLARTPEHMVGEYQALQSMLDSFEKALKTLEENEA
jgi:hypothetical protein